MVVGTLFLVQKGSGDIDMEGTHSCIFKCRRVAAHAGKPTFECFSPER